MTHSTALYMKAMNELKRESAKIGAPIHDGNATDKIKRLLARIEIISQLQTSN